MRVLIALVVVVCTSVWSAAVHAAAPPDLGSPILRKFGFKEYRAHPQVWSIAQDARGVLYFTTFYPDRLVEFDGVEWRIIPVDGDFFSVVIAADDHIYLGGVGELGTLDPGPAGELVYRSLLDRIVGKKPGPAEEILVTDAPGGVIFQSDSAIYRWRGDALHSLEVAPRKFRSAVFAVQDRILFATKEEGLMELRGNDIVPLRGSEGLGNQPVAALLPHGRDGILVATESEGLFLYQDGRLEAFGNEIGPFLKKNIVLCGSELPGAGYVFGTQTGGAVQLAPDGSVVRHLNPALGLDATIYDILLDVSGNLWMGTAQGLYQAELLSPVTFISNDIWVGGAILDLATHGDDVYLGTFRGLYRASGGGSTPSAFTVVPGMETETWSLLSVGESLLVAASDGVFALQDGKQEKLLEKLSFELRRSRFDGDTVYVGREGGVERLRKTAAGWKATGTVAKVDDSVYSIVESAKTELWLGSQSDRLYRARLGEQGEGASNKEAKVEVFTGIGRNLNAHWLRDELVVSSFEGLFEVAPSEDGSGDALRPHRRILFAAGADRRIHSLRRDRSGEVWATSVDQILRGQLREDGSVLLRQDAALGRVMEGVTEMQEDPTDPTDLWFFAYDGVYRLRRDQPLREVAPGATLIRRVTHPASGEVVFGGGSPTLTIAGPGEGTDRIWELPFSGNSLRFEFAAPLVRGGGGEFQTFLEGFDSDWSEWGTRSRKEYTNLGHGDYVFRVRARGVDGQLSEPASFSFTVAHPWYRTWWATLLQILLAVLVIGLITGLRSRSLCRANLHLEGEVEKRTLLLQEEKVFVERQAAELERMNRILEGEIEHRKKASEERRELETRIRQAQKMESLGVLAGGIAHDFNNLLVGILGNADLALLELPEDAPGRERVRNVFGGARRAAALCQQMLEFSGKSRFVESAIDLTVVVSEIYRLLSSSFPVDIDVRLDLAKNLPMVNGDRSQIGQVIMNLLLNAKEALAEKAGCVTVETGETECDRERLDTTFLADPLPEGRYVFVRIQDTGVGMEAETRRKIFDPFFSTKFTGRGLGLASALGIIRSHRGAISIESEVGQGTEMIVYFPAVVTENEELETEATGQSWTSSGKVLVVDDEEPVRMVARAMLNLMGFEVETARNGQEALDIFCAEPESVAAVLLDLTMPEMNGGEVFRRLRALREDLPIVVSSGFSEQAAQNLCPMDGPAGFVRKPYQSNDLSDQLRRVLGFEDEGRARRAATNSFSD